MQSVTCKNDNSANFFLIMSPDPYLTSFSFLLLATIKSILLAFGRIVEQVNGFGFSVKIHLLESSILDLWGLYYRSYSLMISFTINVGCINY